RGADFEAPIPRALAGQPQLHHLVASGVAGGRPTGPTTEADDADEADEEHAVQMTTTFDGLGLSPDLVAALAASGITDPFPIQAATIPDGLAGRDVCGKAKTGSGKTLAFGLPMVERTDAASPKRPRAPVLV